MKTTNKTYIHITKNVNGKAKEFAWPDSKVQKSGAGLPKHSLITYPETEFETVKEFVESNILDDLKLAVINRGWTLEQQQTARQIVLDNDPARTSKDLGVLDFDAKDRPTVDIFDLVNTPKERRGGTPESKARSNMQKLAEADPEKLLALLAEFEEQIKAAQAAQR